MEPKEFFDRYINEITKWIAIIGMFVIALTCIIGMSVVSCKREKENKIYKIEVPPNPVTDKLANINFEDSVYQYIKQVGIKHSDIVFSQAKLESNNFKSELFKKHNNMFGMKKAYSRPSTNINDKNHYAHYDTWQDSVLDYALFQSNLKQKQFRSDDEYAKYISKFYAEDQTYYHKIINL